MTEASLDEQLLSAVSEQNLSLVRSLLDQGAKASYVRKIEGTWGACDQETPLHVAINGGKSDSNKESKDPEAAQTRRAIVTLLLERGANLNVQAGSSDWRGCGSFKTALSLLLGRFARGIDCELLPACVRAGFDPNLADVQSHHSMRYDGSTRTYPLHRMVKGNAPTDLVRQFLDCGADPNLLETDRGHHERAGGNRNSKTSPLHMAIANGNVGLVELLLQRGADPNTLKESLVTIYDYSNDFEDGDPREEDYDGGCHQVPVTTSPLCLAVKKAQPDIVRLLLLHGADISVPMTQAEEQTPRHLLPPHPGVSRGGRSTKKMAKPPAAAPRKEVTRLPPLVASAFALARESSACWRALCCSWTPARHYAFPPDIKRAIFAVMCAARHATTRATLGRLSSDLVQMVCRDVAAQWPLPAPPPAAAACPAVPAAAACPAVPAAAACPAVPAAAAPPPAPAAAHKSPAPALPKTSTKTPQKKKATSLSPPPRASAAHPKTTTASRSPPPPKKTASRSPPPSKKPVSSSSPSPSAAAAAATAERSPAKKSASRSPPPARAPAAPLQKASAPRPPPASHDEAANARKQASLSPPARKSAS